MLNIHTFMTKKGVRKEYDKGEMLFYAGDSADGLYYVETGEIRVYRMDEQGREMEVVRLAEGDILGEAILFVNPEFPFFAQASVSSKIWFLSKSTLFRELENNSEAVHFFLNLLARKCLILNRRIEILGFLTVRQRLIQYLLNQCPGGGACRIELAIKKTELAHRLGTISETLSRNFKQLQEEGKIRVEGRFIQVLDCPALRAEIS